MRTGFIPALQLTHSPQNASSHQVHRSDGSCHTGAYFFNANWPVNLILLCRFRTWLPIRSRSVIRVVRFISHLLMKLQGTLCIVNRSSLENYTALLKHHPQASELLDELRVFFQKDSAFPLYLLRECLSLSSSITDLTLEIGNASPYPRTLFPSLCFPRLQFFKTSVPHSLLIDFMSTHSSLRVLVLGNCGRKKICPLGRGTVNLPEVADLQCPIGCGLLEAAPAVVCLKITHGSLPTPTSTCIAHIPKASSLTHLTVPLASTDFDVISKVFKFAPRVRKLHLVYYSGSQVGSPHLRYGVSNF